MFSSRTVAKYILRLYILIVVQIALMMFEPYIVVFFMLYVNNTYSLVEQIVISCLHYLFPFVLGYILIKNKEMCVSWLISLPIQFVIYVLMYRIILSADIPLASLIMQVILLIVPQAVGVGIKMLYLSIKAKRLQKSNTPE